MTGLLIGHARVSTEEQDLSQQRGDADPFSSRRDERMAPMVREVVEVVDVQRRQRQSEGETAACYPRVVLPAVAARASRRSPRSRPPVRATSSVTGIGVRAASQRSSAARRGAPHSA